MWKRVRRFVWGFSLVCAINCNKLTVNADAGISKFFHGIECAPIEYSVYTIPSYSGFKSFMGYNLFGRKTAQYDLQQKAYTDEYGFRKIDDYYMIAVGQYFDVSLGQRLDLVLENGERIKCILGDMKAPQDTDKTNMFSMNGCLSEFLVDEKSLESTIKSRGDVSTFPCEDWNSPVSYVVIYERYIGVEENGSE